MKTVTLNIPDIKDWKTTICGLVAACGTALMVYSTTGTITWKGALAVIGNAALGYFAGDKSSSKGQ